MMFNAQEGFRSRISINLRRRLIAASCSLLVWVLCAPPQASVVAEPTPEEIQQAIERLGSDPFEQREEASKFLWEHGRSAERALEQAKQSDDPEVRRRARAVLAKLRYGIFPDTSTETIALIQQFRDGDRGDRQEAWRKLKNLGQFEVLLRLSEVVASTEQWAEIEPSFLADAHLLAQAILVRGDFERAREWLFRSSRYPDPMPRHYAAFCLLRGELDGAIRQAEASGAPCVQEQARVQAHLWRLKGDFRRALALAEQADDRELVFDLLYRLEDWAGIVDRQLIPGGAGVEQLGFTTAFNRLAGNESAAAAAVQALKDLPLDRYTSAGLQGEALMINEQWDDALELYRKHSSLEAMQLLLARRQYEQAFGLVGYQPGQRRSASWLTQFEAPREGDLEPSNQRFYSAVALARALNKLGLREESQGLLADLTNSLFEVKRRVAAIAHLEWELGLKSQAWRHAAEGQEDPSRFPPLYAFLPNRASEAYAWWKYFSTRKNAPAADALAQVRQVMFPNPEDDRSQPDFQALVEDVVEAGKSLEAGQRAAEINILASTCLARGERTLAVELLKQSALLSSRGEALVRLGDLCIEQGHFREALDWYNRASEKDQASAIALFLKGSALLKLGDVAAGQRAMELASLLPLGDVAVRNRFAEALRKRGYAKEVAQQYELILRIGPQWTWESQEAWAMSDASQHYGHHIVAQDPMLAAACWQRSLHGVLKTNSAFLEASSYTQLAQLVHQVKARGFLQQGAHQSALREIRLADVAMPGSITLAIDTVPLLDQAGLTDAGDELFESVYRISEELQRHFPHHPGFHNNLAWLGARCRRRLQESLQLAQRAVELEPLNARYVDTLAEVLYQQGDHQRALEQAERCVQLAPDSEFYRQRLERITQRRP